MKFDQISGPGYQAFSRKAECQISRNLYRVKIETGEGIAPYVTYRAFGTSVYSRPSGAAGRFRGMLSRDTSTKFHAFVVVDNTIYDIREKTTDGMAGPIAVDASNVSMACSVNSLLIVSAGHLYRINAGALAEIVLTFVPKMVVFLKNYFVVLSDSLQQFYFSSDDGATFPGGNVQDFEADSNAVFAIAVMNQQLMLIGTRITQWYTVIANANAPFAPQDAGVFSSGTRAPYSVAQLSSSDGSSESMFYLENSRSGQNRVMRVVGYSAQRISNHWVENLIRELTRDSGTDDAIGMCYELNGQQFYRLTFPAADYTIEFNVTANDWNERLYWAWTNGEYHRDRANCIMSAFGKILIGDWQNGYMFELSPDNYTEFGYPLKWVRQCPHILEENRNVSYGRLELGIETGGGPENPLWLQNYSLDRAAFVTALAAAVVALTVTAAQALVLQSIYDNAPYTPLDPYPDADTMNALGFAPWGAVAMLADGTTVLGEPPQIAMDYSDDGAKSFYQSLERSLGAFGTNEDVFWDRLGTGRDRVFRLEGDSPGKLAITGAWLGDTEALDS